MRYSYLCIWHYTFGSTPNDRTCQYALFRRTLYRSESHCVRLWEYRFADNDKYNDVFISMDKTMGVVPLACSFLDYWNDNRNNVAIRNNRRHIRYLLRNYDNACSDVRYHIHGGLLYRKHLHPLAVANFVCNTCCLCWAQKYRSQ